MVDSESTDDTAAIAAECGARVISRPWPGFALQKQFTTDQAAYDWVLSLDADERVSQDLKDEIAALQARDASELADGYRIPRRSFYMGRWIRGGGWYPDHQLRLFRRDRAQWQGSHIHESVKLNDGARVETLTADILHYPVRDASYHHRMIGERYAPLAARQMFEAGRRTSAFKIATAAPATFVRSWLLKAGWRDGLAGLSIASFAAHHAFLKHLLLWELQQKEDSRQ